MDTHLLTFRPPGIQACAIPGHPKPESNRLKTTSSSSSANWWVPTSGWSSEPDYINPNKKTEGKEKRESKSETDLGKPAISKFPRGCLTEEKARQLRIMTTKTSSFHDVMYHSAIASRLASNFKDHTDL